MIRGVAVNIVRLPRVTWVPFLLACAVGPAAQTAAGQTDSTRKTDTTAATAATGLPTVIVSGRNVTVPKRYEAAYKRAAAGRGYYFTREEIEASNPHDLEALLVRVPTVQTSDRGVSFAKCQAGLPSPSGAMQRAQVQVYIDERRASLTDADGVSQLLKGIPVSTVQLMEVYTGVSRIPGEFVNDACAVIVIWTKSY
jgi:hypothetical protein